MKISLDTETDTYESALATVQAAFGVKVDPNGKAGIDPADLDEDDYLPGKWSKKRLAKFAAGLADDAAEAVRYIAAHAPAVSIDETIAHMAKHLNEPDLNGQAMGGRMSSVGFAWKSVKYVSGPPLDTDYKHRMYRIDASIAAVLAEILGPPSST